MRARVIVPLGDRARSLTGAAMVAAFAAMGCARSGPLPPDASLARTYREHQQELNALATMVVADTMLVGAGYDPMQMRFTVYVRDTPRSDRLLGDWEVRSSGRSAYRKLLDRAGLRGVSRSRGPGGAWFVVAVDAVARKGLVYSVKPLGPVQSALDGQEATVRRTWQTLYAPLAPGWYVFLEPKAE